MDNFQENATVQKPKVLLVDDEEDICDSLKSLVETLGCEVMTACSGEEALRIIQNETLLGAWVDMRLPTALQGVDVIRELRQKHPVAPVVAMSGYVDMEIRREAEKLSVADFWLKPDDLQPGLFLQRAKKILNLEV